MFYLLIDRSRRTKFVYIIHSIHLRLRCRLIKGQVITKDNSAGKLLRVIHVVNIYLGLFALLVKAGETVHGLFVSVDSRPLGTARTLGVNRTIAMVMFFLVLPRYALTGCGLLSRSRGNVRPRWPAVVGVHTALWAVLTILLLELRFCSKRRNMCDSITRVT